MLAGKYTTDCEAARDVVPIRSARRPVVGWQLAMGVREESAGTCEWCLFQMAIGPRLRYVVTFSPDQAKMMKRSKRGEPGFAYDGADLNSARLTILESEARHRRAPLRRGEHDPLADATMGSE